MSPRWLPAAIEKIRRRAQDGNVLFTLKALRELAELDLELDETDVCEVLKNLHEGDFRNRVASTVTREYLYIFAPTIASVEVYLKVVIRDHCVVISFHEDRTHED